MKTNNILKHISVIMIWVVILLISVNLAFIFNGEFFWLRVVIALPFVYGAVRFTQKTYNEKQTD